MGSLPGRYLGIPLFGGASNLMVWKDLVDYCLKHMDGWKSRWLTSTGRIMMLKSIISAIPFFSMMCLKIPKKIVKVVG